MPESARGGDVAGAAMRLAAAAVAIAALVRSRFWALPAGGDRALYDHFAQEMARGAIAYRDVIEVKTPLSAWIGGLAIRGLAPFGVGPILATRLSMLAVAVLVAVAVAAAARRFAANPWAGWLAAAIFCGIDRLPELLLDGVQPKAPMVLCGLGALLAAGGGRPFAAGALAVLAGLSWQPGLLFLGCAFLVVSRDLTRLRHPDVARLLAGAGLTALAFAVYLVATGAAAPFWTWAMRYLREVYAPLELRSPARTATRLATLFRRPLRDLRPFAALAVIGVAIELARAARRAVRGDWSGLAADAPRHGWVVALLAYLAFCFVNLQGIQDIFPLLPFVAIFAATAIAAAAAALARAVPGARPGAVLAALGLAVALGHVVPARAPGAGLDAQRAEVDAIVAHLRPGESILAVGCYPVLALSDAPSASPLTMLDHRKDEFLDEVEPGGFTGWLGRLQAARPGIVAIRRDRALRNSVKMPEMRAWLERDYDPRRGTECDYWLRRRGD